MTDDPFLVEEFEHEGVHVEIRQDEMPENPRSAFDHVGHIVWIQDANTKNFRLEDEMVGIYREDMEKTCPACRGRGEFGGGRRTYNGDYAEPRPCNVCDTSGEVPTEDIVEWIKSREPDAHLVIPIYFSDNRYDASIAVEDADTANGVIYVTKEQIVSEWGSRGNLTGQATRNARKYLLGEIAEYDAYSKNEVYGYVVGEGDEQESCWGFYGELDYVREEAKSVATSLAKKDKVTS